jgi:hypothetical protein
MVRLAWTPLVALIFLLGCSATRSGPGWDVSSPDGRAVHEASGLSFPEHLPDLERGGTRAFDESGSNSSIAYSGSTFPLEITVFVYPRAVVPGASREDHFRSALSDVYRYHPRARLEVSGPTQVPLSTEKVEALSAFLTFVDQGKDLGSWLIVLPAGDYIVKVRATYERPEEEATAGLRLRRSFGAIESILQSIQRESPASEYQAAAADAGCVSVRETGDVGERPARLSASVRLE